MRFAYSLIPWSPNELAEGVQAAALQGYDGVELTNDHLDAIDDNQTRSFRNALDETGLALAAVGVGFLGFDEKVPTRCRQAKELGAERLIWLAPLRVVNEPAVLVDEVPAIEELADSLQLDASCHVHTGTLVENETEAVELVRKHPGSTLCFDTAHSGLFGSLQSFVDRLGTAIAHVHVRGLRRPPEEILAGYLPERKDLRVLTRMASDLVPPGEGVLSLQAPLRSLAHIHGWWSVELEPVPDARQREQELNESLTVMRTLAAGARPGDSASGTSGRSAGI